MAWLCTLSIKILILQEQNPWHLSAHQPWKQMAPFHNPAGMLHTAFQYIAPVCARFFQIW